MGMDESVSCCRDIITAFIGQSKFQGENKGEKYLLVGTFLHKISMVNSDRPTCTER